MSSSFDASFYKIAAVADLPAGEPQVFRAAGATVVVRRTGDEVSAIDGSCLAEDRQMSPEQRLKRIFDCISAGTGNNSKEWEHLHSRAGLPVRVEDGSVWVCIDACRP